MRQLLQYCKERARFTEQEFIARHAQPVLLYRVMPTEEAVNASFKTVAAPVREFHPSLSPMQKVEDIRLNSPLIALGLSKTVSGRAVAELVVFPIAKQPGAVFQDRVSVGRTKNSDICLPFPNISKLHAFFTVPRSGCKYRLADAESTNGTFVDNKRLPPGQAAEVEDWTPIHFGKFQFLFFSPPCLYTLLRVD